MNIDLTLIDYKDIEREALAMLLQGKKIVLSGKLMLDNARENIKLLGGKTSEEEDEEFRQKLKENDNKHV